MLLSGDTKTDELERRMWV